VLLGTNINYFIRADWQGGHYPTIATQFYQLSYSTLTEGGHKWIYLNARGTMPQDVPYNPVYKAPLDKNSLIVEYKIPYHVSYGGSYWDYPGYWDDDFLFANKIDDGSINTFITDSINFYKYSKDSFFDAYNYFDSLTSGHMSFDMPGIEDYYVSFSNKNKKNISEFASIKVYLLNGPTSVSDISLQTSNIRIYPNPTEGIINIEKLNNEDANIEIFNSVGQLAYKTYLDKSSNNKQLNLSGFPKGIYLIRIYNKEKTEVKKLVIQ
jgi:hypothetical protein